MSLDLPEELRWLAWLAGAAWPDGDEDQLFELAKVWEKASKDTKALIPSVEAAKKAAMRAYGDGEGGAAIAKLFDPLLTGDESLDQLAQNYQQISDAVFDMGTQVESVKLTVIVSLVALAIEIIWAWLFPPTAAAAEAVAVASTRSFLRTFENWVVKDVTALAQKLGALAQKGLRKFPGLGKVQIKPSWFKNTGLYAQKIPESMGISVFLDGLVQTIELGKGHSKEWNWKQTLLSGAAAGVGTYPGIKSARETGKNFDKLFGSAFKPKHGGGYFHTQVKPMAGDGLKGGISGITSGAVSTFFGNGVVALDPDISFKDANGSPETWVGGMGRGGIVGGGRGILGYKRGPDNGKMGPWPNVFDKNMVPISGKGGTSGSSGNGGRSENDGTNSIPMHDLGSNNGGNNGVSRGPSEHNSGHPGDGSSRPSGESTQSRAQVPDTTPTNSRSSDPQNPVSSGSQRDQTEPPPPVDKSQPEPPPVMPERTPGDEPPPPATQERTTGGEPPPPVTHERAPGDQPPPVTHERTLGDEPPPVTHERTPGDEPPPVTHERTPGDEPPPVTHERTLGDEPPPITPDRTPGDEPPPVHDSGTQTPQSDKSESNVPPPVDKSQPQPETQTQRPAADESPVQPHDEQPVRGPESQTPPPVTHDRTQGAEPPPVIHERAPGDEPPPVTHERSPGDEPPPVTHERAPGNEPPRVTHERTPGDEPPPVRDSGAQTPQADKSQSESNVPPPVNKSQPQPETQTQRPAADEQPGRPHDEQPVRDSGPQTPPPPVRDLGVQAPPARDPGTQTPPARDPSTQTPPVRDSRPQTSPPSPSGGDHRTPPSPSPKGGDLKAPSLTPPPPRPESGPPGRLPWLDRVDVPLDRPRSAPPGAGMQPPADVAPPPKGKAGLAPDGGNVLPHRDSDSPEHVWHGYGRDPNSSSGTDDYFPSLRPDGGWPPGSDGSSSTPTPPPVPRSGSGSPDLAPPKQSPSSDKPPIHQPKPRYPHAPKWMDESQPPSRDESSPPPPRNELSPPHDKSQPSPRDEMSPPRDKSSSPPRDETPPAPRDETSRPPRDESYSPPPRDESSPPKPQDQIPWSDADGPRPSFRPDEGLPVDGDGSTWVKVPSPWGEHGEGPWRSGADPKAPPPQGKSSGDHEPPTSTPPAKPTVEDPPAKTPPQDDRSSTPPPDRSATPPDGDGAPPPLRDHTPPPAEGDNATPRPALDDPFSKYNRPDKAHAVDSNGARTEVGPDTTTIQKRPSGTVSVRTPDGTEHTFTSGESRVKDPNGETIVGNDTVLVRSSRPGGYPPDVWIDHRSGKVHVGPDDVLPPGQRRDFGNGTIVERTPDGAKITYADGPVRDRELRGDRVVTTYRDGSTREARIDGTVVVTAPDGREWVIRGDGVTRLTGPNGRSWIGTDGAIWTIGHDGTVDRQVLKKTAAGTWIIEFQSKGTALPGGELKAKSRPKLIRETDGLPGEFHTPDVPDLADWVPDGYPEPPDEKKEK
ncbi:hypothetical protein [Nocardia sp. NPDC049149]|uniref:WXG100-like domain-containing protein n=1 Tax=Nocardia sp. NPDC049149 TaxID=3364315 RepID=UPI00371A413F